MKARVDELLTHFRRRISVLGIGLSGLVAIVMTGLNGCEDLLPVYEEPKNVFKVLITVPSNEVINYSGRDSNDPSRAPYVVNPSGIEIDVGVENLHDDALQGEIYVSGKLDMVWEKDPDMKITLPLHASQAGSNPGIDYTTNTMTILPNQRMWFRLTWDYKWNGRWVFAFSSFSYYFENRRYYLLHEPMIFNARATVQLFSTKTGQARSELIPLTFTFHGSLSFPP